MPCDHQWHCFVTSTKTCTSSESESMELPPHTDEIILLARITIKGALCHVTEAILGPQTTIDPHGLAYQRRCELSYAGTLGSTIGPLAKINGPTKLMILSSTMGFIKLCIMQQRR